MSYTNRRILILYIIGPRHFKDRGLRSLSRVLLTQAASTLGVI